MAKEIDYTFQLAPNQKRRYIAGPYDPKTNSPKYKISINIWQHLIDRVECNQILIGTSEHCNWAYDLNNKTTWPAYISVKKDGQLLKE